MSAVLFVPFYQDKNSDRFEEVLFCLKKNLSNFFLDEIVLVTEQNCDLFFHRKLRIVNVPERPTFKDVFKIIEALNPNGYNFVCNADIYFPLEDVVIATSFLDEVEQAKRTVLALSRWNRNFDGSITHYNKKSSQDSWVFKGCIDENVKGDFYFGIPGCDGRIAYELSTSGHFVINPSKHLKSIHLHVSGVRNYSQEIRVPGPHMHPVPF